MVILTDGHTEPITAKTAASVIRYCRSEVLALLDRHQAGQTSEALLGVGGNLPVIGALDEVPDANTLMIGIAPSGGRVPADWRPILLEAISRGMDIVSGLHDFLQRDAELASAAQRQGVRLIDVRQNEEHDVAERLGHSRAEWRPH